MNTGTLQNSKKVFLTSGFCFIFSLRYLESPHLKLRGNATSLPIRTDSVSLTSPQTAQDRLSPPHIKPRHLTSTHTASHRLTSIPTASHSLIPPQNSYSHITDFCVGCPHCLTFLVPNISSSFLIEFNSLLSVLHSFTVK